MTSARLLLNQFSLMQKYFSEKYNVPMHNPLKDILPHSKISLIKNIKLNHGKNNNNTITLICRIAIKKIIHLLLSNQHTKTCDQMGRWHWVDHYLLSSTLLVDHTA